MRTPAYATTGASEALGPFTLERREPGAEEVLIDILYCGVCHSDLHQARNEWGGSRYPMVPGHEIIGRVSRVGAEVDRWQVGDLVGVGCFVDSCRRCPSCEEGEEQYCDVGMTETYNGLERDGVTPTQGGYSKRITVDQRYVLRIPPSIPIERAAPLLCAGITCYSPLRHFDLKPGDELAVVGLGGLGHMAVKLGAAMGARVTVISHSPHKREAALALGAADFIAVDGPRALKPHRNRFDLILDTVSAAHDYNAYLALLRRDRTMVLVGVPPASEVHCFSLIGKRRSLAGSLIGGIRETQEMLDFCGEHGIAADVELIAMDQINQAYERMLRSDVKYRFVIDLATLPEA